MQRYREWLSLGLLVMTNEREAWKRAEGEVKAPKQSVDTSKLRSLEGSLLLKAAARQVGLFNL